MTPLLHKETTSIIRSRARCSAPTYCTTTLARHLCWLPGIWHGCMHVIAGTQRHAARHPILATGTLHDAGEPTSTRGHR